MTFEYGVEFHRSLSDAYDFPNLREGASMLCHRKEQAKEIVDAFNAWAFSNRSPYAASTYYPLAVSEGKPAKGWRVWIVINEQGADALKVDPVAPWVEARVQKTMARPAKGWMITAEFYRDFYSWCKSRGLSDNSIPPANTFTQRFKKEADAEFRRRAIGMTVIGATLKKTDLEAANGIDPDPL